MTKERRQQAARGARQQSDPLGGPGVLEAPLRPASFVFPFKDDSIPELDGAEGVIVLGGQAMPEDPDVPYLEPVRELLRSPVQRKVPTLGLCLGAELLCQATGGDVHKLDAPEIGWVALERGDDASDPSEVYALRVGACAWGIEPHPQHALPVLSILFAENRDEVAEAGIDVEELRAESARRPPRRAGRRPRLRSP